MTLPVPLHDGAMRTTSSSSAGLARALRRAAQQPPPRCCACFAWNTRPGSSEIPVMVKVSSSSSLRQCCFSAYARGATETGQPGVRNARVV